MTLFRSQPDYIISSGSTSPIAWPKRWCFSLAARRFPVWISCLG